jgi:hypothetical protein
MILHQRSILKKQVDAHHVAKSCSCKMVYARHVANLPVLAAGIGSARMTIGVVSAVPCYILTARFVALN